ncbi:MAG: hypothetical protein K0U45_06710 [Alphaproteobacteria bacterium]|nr:hypothetical protein [Alphaproteobacteria bacterium]
MNIKQFLKEIGFPSFDSEGYPIFGGALLLTLIGALLWKPIAWLGGIILILSAFHFRKITRTPSDSDNNILALGDGTVQEIETLTLPAEFSEAGQSRIRMRIKSKWLDSQMLFAPQTGVVTEAEMIHSPLFAKGNLEQERGDTQSFVLSAQDKIYIVVYSPILGKKFLDATDKDKSLNAGDALGMARMVNITDIFLPTNVKLLIKEGQQTVGGETIIAQFAENSGVKDDTDAVKKKTKTENE